MAQLNSAVLEGMQCRAGGQRGYICAGGKLLIVVLDHLYNHHKNAFFGIAIF
jgi:hypothetical protein